MKKVLITLTLVLCLLLTACSAGGGKAISDDLLKAFDGTREEAEKLLNMTPEDSGDVAGDVAPGTTYASYVTVQKWCGRDMETRIYYMNDSIRYFMGTAAFPANEETKAFLEDCFKQLQKQFGDPYSIGSFWFPNGGASHEYTSGEEAAAFEDFWNNEEVRGMEISFHLPPVPENSFGLRRVDVTFSKDAGKAENVQVEISLYDSDKVDASRGR